ncbi:MAG TPA: permease [Candidatus Limnocylindrales bacterium]|nr:permease [Candidatus Limnocylindrales bacterium]
MPLTDVLPWVTTQVANSVLHNWPFLVLGVVSAAALKVYLGTERIASLFRSRTGYAVAGSVGAAVVTPFCSCGTTAVVLSMMASSVPWAPIVAFMVASPLTSPSELVVSAGLFGWPFAAFYFVAAIVLGLAAGAIAFVVEGAGLLKNQARFAEPAACTSPACATAGAQPVPLGIGPRAAAVAEFAARRDRWRLAELGRETLDLGRRMLVLFVGFAAIGYTAIALIPTAWMTTLLGGSSPLSVVVAATLGVPFYVSSEASLPLVAGLMQGGMGSGPAMAFLITGAGTSLGAISGALLIARWRVLALIVGSLWAGAIVLGLLAGAVL